MAPLPPAELPFGQDAPVTLEATLERAVFKNEETGFAVLELRAKDGAPITAVGLLSAAQPGEELRLAGRWVEDKRYGRQLKVDSYLALTPTTLVGLERYLGSGLVPGIGPAMARRLVERFGLGTLEVIEKKSYRLTEVEGIGKVRAERIQRAWTEQRELREVMVFLQSHEISTAFALRIVKRYGARAMQVVTRNPYQLAGEVFGVGFLTADRLARRLGFALDSPERAAAGVLFALEEHGDQGHVHATEDELLARAAQLLELAPELIHLALQTAVDRGQVRRERPDPAAPALIYPPALYQAEVSAAERAAMLVRAPPPAPLRQAADVLARFQAGAKIELAPAQQRAVERTVGARLAVITGGPGTGKTTIVRALLALCQAAGRRALLAAPTGRAAKRLTEATGHEASTLHRLLEFSPETNRFTRGPEDPLDAEVVIVDEASMLDLVLFSHLLEAVPARAQLVLVGDVDQLPSVGPGSVLPDVIRSGVAEVSVLDQIFRQAEQSQIVVNAHRIRRGELPGVPEEERERSDFLLLERPQPEQALATLRELVERRIPRRFQLDPRSDIQVLTPMHKGSLGAQALNRELQALLNPGGDALVKGEQTLRVGDKVMQLRNNYELGVYNGDLGRIAALDAEERLVRVQFDERTLEYGPDLLDELTLAYACTIHKSQGSEYPAVIVVLGEQHQVMLERNLLYTAVTRGRRLVVVLAHPRALERAVRFRRDHRRRSRLADRIAELTEVGGPRPA